MIDFEFSIVERSSVVEVAVTTGVFRLVVPYFDFSFYKDYSYQYHLYIVS